MQATGANSWRPKAVFYKKNNIYINLDESQWERFQTHSMGEENIPPEPTLLRYLYATEHQPPKLFFSKRSLKDYAEKQGLPYRVTEKKVPAPDVQTLTHLLRAYMTEKKLSELVTEHCYGCQYDMPGQRDHSCLEEDASENYKHLIALTDVSQKVCKVAEALGLDPKLYQPKGDLSTPVQEAVPEDYSILFQETL